MGLTYRKGLKLGPVRLNLSGSGVGFSVGFLGMRVGKSARGERYATADLPLGFRYRQTLSDRARELPAPRVAPFEAGIVDLSGGDEFWFDIEGETAFQDNIVAAATEVEKHGGTEPIIPVFLFRLPSHDIGVAVTAGHSYLEAGTIPASSVMLRELADRLGDDEASVGTCMALIFDENGKYGLKLNIERGLAE